MSTNERLEAALVVSCALLSAVACDAGSPERSPAPGPLPAPTSLSPLVEATGATFPEWGIPIAPGTRVCSYPTVTVEERYGTAITIEPDLVVGGDPTDPHSLFYRPSDVAVDGEGRMYVLDQGDHRIQVFASDGTFLRSIGAEGQGPGEFSGGRELEVAGDRLFVWDAGKRRVVTWDLDGIPGDEFILQGVGIVTELDALGAATLLVTHTEVLGQLTAGGRIDFIVQLFGTDGTAGPVLLRLPSAWPISEGAPRPIAAAAAPGDAYVSPAAEYQLHAFKQDGEAAWAVRMNWPRESTEGDRERAGEFMRERYPQFSSEERARRVQRLYPRDFHDALGGIYVDGHGHIYVRPALPVAQTRDLGAAMGDDYAWPFDVYTAAGEHLFSGSMARVSWLDARGDYVYYLSTNVETEERILVRAILREPF